MASVRSSSFRMASALLLMAEAAEVCRRGGIAPRLRRDRHVGCRTSGRARGCSLGKCLCVCSDS
eukprot:4999556-Alexandrium_andersonii.AAC.1